VNRLGRSRVITGHYGKYTISAPDRQEVIGDAIKSVASIFARKLHPLPEYAQLLSRNDRHKPQSVRLNRTGMPKN
jgi:hypothetical protein